MIESKETDPKYVAKLVRKLYNERSDLLEIYDRSDEQEARLVSIEKAIGMYPTRRDPSEQEAMDLIKESAEILRNYRDKSVDMIIFCPNCKLQHIDLEEDEDCTCDCAFSDHICVS
jgi:hypothetical protein